MRIGECVDLFFDCLGLLAPGQWGYRPPRASWFWWDRTWRRAVEESRRAVVGIARIRGRLRVRGMETGRWTGPVWGGFFCARARGSSKAEGPIRGKSRLVYACEPSGSPMAEGQGKSARLFNGLRGVPSGSSNGMRSATFSSVTDLENFEERRRRNGHHSATCGDDRVPVYSSRSVLIRVAGGKLASASQRSAGHLIATPVENNLRDECSPMRACSHPAP
jgi:hypothetical protein